MIKESILCVTARCNYVTSLFTNSPLAHRLHSLAQFFSPVIADQI